MYTKNTKLVCTLGPATSSVKKITALIKAGMNVARLNFSHGDYEGHTRLIENIRKAETETGKRVAIMQDLQGPKIRIGKMPEKGITVKKDQLITMTVKEITGEEKNGKIIIPVRHKGLIKDAKKGKNLLIDDGLIETEILKVSKTNVLCKVKFGGKIESGNGVNLPLSKISIETITPKDKKDLKFGLKNKVEFIALSFVKSAKDIKALRKLMGEKNSDVRIVAKIERHEAIKNLKEIIHAADAVMVARGDLGTDIPAEKVPIVQKRMITLANSMGKPVITATQVLQSMVKSPRPTRAEVSDAATAVFDHSDAIMLSNETAVGKYPVKAVSTLKRVALSVEKELQKHEELQEYILNKHYISPVNATCLNACELAMDYGADYIVVYSEDGYTANNVAKHRIYIPIITITPHEKTARRLMMTWGINDVFVEEMPKDSNEKIKAILALLKEKKVVKKNNKLVIVCNASKRESLISTIKI